MEKPLSTPKNLLERVALMAETVEMGATLFLLQTVPLIALLISGSQNILEPKMVKTEGQQTAKGKMVKI